MPQKPLVRQTNSLARYTPGKTSAQRHTAASSPCPDPYAIAASVSSLSVQVMRREAAVATSTAATASAAQRAYGRLTAIANAIGVLGTQLLSSPPDTAPPRPLFTRRSRPCQGTP